MASVSPYLNFNGNCEEAFNFYKAAFGGDFQMIMRFKDAPPSDHTTAEEGDKIMHVSLPIGNGTYILGSDIPSAYGSAIIGTNSSISINADSEEQATQLFNDLSAGGKVTMPLDKMFWGSFFGMFTDKFGIQWMVSYDYNQNI